MSDSLVQYGPGSSATIPAFFENAYLAGGEDLPNNTQGVTNKPVISSTYSFLTDIGAALVSHVSKNTPGQLAAFAASNESAARLFFQVWDSTTVGTGTLKAILAVPAGSATVPGFGSMSLSDFGANGLNCATGVAWGWSTTAGTYSAVGSGTGLSCTVVYV